MSTETELADNQKRIAIAEACGWRRVSVKERGFSGKAVKVERWRMPNSILVRPSSLPDFLGSLDAMHEAEQTLTEDQQLEYWLQLAKSARAHPERGYWALIHATAQQRADAFLATISATKS